MPFVKRLIALARVLDSAGGSFSIALSGWAERQFILSTPIIPNTEMNAYKSHIRANSITPVTTKRSTGSNHKGRNWKGELSMELPFLWTPVVVW